MSRTVVVGLDGFHEGLLSFTPTVRGICECEGGAALQSTIPPFTAPAWATFQTGTDVDTHSVLDFVSYDENFEIEMIDGRDLATAAFYEVLERDGVSCYLQNLPFAIPPRVDGDVMPSWLDDDDTRPHPPDLNARYGVEKPRYPDFDPNDSTLDRIGRMENCFEHNSRIFLRVLEAKDHDFLFHLVSVTDWLQHKALEELQQCPESDVGQRARAILEAVDSFVAEVKTLLDERDNLILLSDHGFRVYDRVFSINDWLREQGYLETSPDGVSFPSRTQQAETTITFGSVVRYLGHLPIVFPVAKRVDRYLRTRFELSVSTRPKVDVENSCAYGVSKDSPYILVDTAETTEGEIAEEIVSKLREHDGIHAKYLPVADETLVILYSDTVHFIRGPTGSQDVWSERRIPYHDRAGIIVGKGPLFDGSPEEPGLVDVAPTLLLALGYPIPESMEGRPLTEWIGHEGEVPTQATDAFQTEFRTGEPTDSEAVKDRLQELGYL